MKLRWKKIRTYQGDWLMGEKSEYKTVLQFKNTENEDWVEVEFVDTDKF